MSQYYEVPPLNDLINQAWIRITLHWKIPTSIFTVPYQLDIPKITKSQKSKYVILRHLDLIDIVHVEDFNGIVM